MLPRFVKQRLGTTALALSIVSAAGALALESTEQPDPESAAATAGKKIFGVTKESGGAVSVELTPERMREGRLEVEIRVNTHTVNDLDKYDLKQITTLEFADESINPTSAPKLEGHHNRGTLAFPLSALPSAFSIKIRGLDKPELRVFSWP